LYAFWAADAVHEDCGPMMVQTMQGFLPTVVANADCNARFEPAWSCFELFFQGQPLLLMSLR
jgi:hypothetical protein